MSTNRKEKKSHCCCSSRRKEAHFNAECGVRNAKCDQSLLTSAATRFIGARVLVLAVLLAFEQLLAAATVTVARAPQTAHTSETNFDFISALFVFMLATFLGLEIVRRVSRLLHTPLMSLTNAISAIAVVGAILVAGPQHPPFIHFLGLIAVVASVTNIVSGFLITDRMLKMFKKKSDPKPK